MGKDFTYFGVGFVSGVSVGVLSTVGVLAYGGYLSYKAAIKYVNEDKPLASVTTIQTVVEEKEDSDESSTEDQPTV